MDALFISFDHRRVVHLMPGTHAQRAARAPLRAVLTPTLHGNPSPPDPNRPSTLAAAPPRARRAAAAAAPCLPARGRDVRAPGTRPLSPIRPLSPGPGDSGDSLASNEDNEDNCPVFIDREGNMVEVACCDYGAAPRHAH